VTSSRAGHFRPGDAGFTVLVLDRIAIERMFLPAGTVFQWGIRLGREVKEAAKALLVPGHGYRTGALQRSVESSVVPVLQAVQINVRAEARHAGWYILGTRTPITSTRTIVYKAGPFKGSSGPGFLRIKNQFGRPIYKLAVRGQAGHNFLNEAKDAVLARRGITV
jgi:hypothetical protein